MHIALEARPGVFKCAMCLKRAHILDPMAGKNCFLPHRCSGNRELTNRKIISESMRTPFFYIDDNTFRDSLIPIHAVDIFTFPTPHTVSMFTVNHDRENVSEETKVENLPHIEFLDDRRGIVSYMVNTRRMGVRTIPK
jgi:hypothetical protein